MLCFRVTINDDAPLVAGEADVAVLTAILTWVSKRHELEFTLGGLAGDSPHTNVDLSWLRREFKAGDRVLIEVIDFDSPTPAPQRRPSDPELVERSRREYFERLKKEYEP